MHLRLEITISGSSAEGKTRLYNEIKELLESKYAVTEIMFLELINNNAEHYELKIEDPR